jgi:hypothetical protein
MPLEITIWVVRPKLVPDMDEVYHQDLDALLAGRRRNVWYLQQIRIMDAGRYTLVAPRASHPHGANPGENMPVPAGSSCAFNFPG